MIALFALLLSMFGFTLIELSAKLADRASSDDDFRRRLLADPEAVLGDELGRKPSGEEVAEFRRLLADASGRI